MPSGQTVHVSVVGLLHGVKILDLLHILDQFFMEARYNDLDPLAPQLLDVQGQLGQGLLVDDLGVPEAEVQGDFLGFYVLLHQRIYHFGVVEVV